MGQDRILGTEIAEAPPSKFQAHPQRDVVPPLTTGQREALRESMLSRGIQDVPIIVTPEKVILDGHNRWDIAREIGWSGLSYVVATIPDHLQVDYMVRTAVERRQLADDSWREMVGKLHAKGWSGRRIAEATDKSEATVRRTVKRGASPDAPAGVGQRGSPALMVIGKDGKSYPAKVPPAKAKPHRAKEYWQAKEAETGVLDRAKAAAAEQPEETLLGRWNATAREVLIQIDRLEHVGQRLINEQPEYRKSVGGVLRKAARRFTIAASTIDPPKKRPAGADLGAEVARAVGAVIASGKADDE